MTKSVLFFNGIGFSFPLVERAFNWAKQNNGSLIALFLKAKHEIREGYVFPSDLDAAQDLQKNEDAETANMNVIHSNMTMLEHSARSEGIDLTMKVLSDPSHDEILQLVSGCACVFVDEKFDQPGILRVEDIHLEKLLKKIQVPLVIARS